MAVSGLNFATQVDDWVRSTQQRMTAVFRQSAQEVVSEMQGKVPVDTGFLRASLVVNLSGPVPATRNKPTSSNFSAAPVTMSIAGADLGDTVYATYGAKYAPFVEYGTSKMQGRAFVRLAAAQWPQIVSRVTARAKATAAR